MARQALLGTLLCTLVACPAAAQEGLDDEAVGAGDDGVDDAGADEMPDEAPPLEGPADGSLEAEQAAMEEEEEPLALLGDEQARLEEEAPAEQFVDSTDPREVEDTDYFFLGAMGRGVIIPGFVQELFVEGGIDGFNPGAGLSFNWRRNNFNVVANVWWNNAVADGYFRANGDPRIEQEFIDVDLGVLFVNAEFLWSFPLTDWLAFEIGFDLGFGFIYGSLVRTEAYESSPGQGDWQPCEGSGMPNNEYCNDTPAPDPCYDNNGGHFQCEEPNWFTEGGDTPFLFPWVALPHLAVRIKPIRQIQIRIDGGYGLYNFFFGGSVSYGF